MYFDSAHYFSSHFGLLKCFRVYIVTQLGIIMNGSTGSFKTNCVDSKLIGSRSRTEFTFSLVASYAPKIMESNCRSLMNKLVN